MIGTQLRFFSEKVFGAWVTGIVESVKGNVVRISATFGGASWKENKHIDTEFYRPHGHPEAGNPFKLR